jgi:hypothetical protein
VPFAPAGLSAASFDAFVLQHGKTYAAEQERQTQFGIYEYAALTLDEFRSSHAG